MANLHNSEFRKHTSILDFCFEGCDVGFINLSNEKWNVLFLLADKYAYFAYVPRVELKLYILALLVVLLGVLNTQRKIN